MSDEDGTVIVSKLEQRELQCLRNIDQWDNLEPRIFELLEQGYGDNSITKVVIRSADEDSQRRLLQLLPSFHSLKTLNVFNLFAQNVETLSSSLGGHSALESITVSFDKDIPRLQSNFDGLLRAICDMTKLKWLGADTAIFESTPNDVRLPPTLEVLQVVDISKLNQGQHERVISYVTGTLLPETSLLSLSLPLKTVSETKTVMKYIEHSKSLNCFVLDCSEALGQSNNDEIATIVADSLKVNKRLLIFKFNGGFRADKLLDSSKMKFIEMLKSNYNIGWFDFEVNPGIGWFKANVEFYTKLNRHGRAAIMSSKSTLTKEESNAACTGSRRTKDRQLSNVRWIDVISSASDDLSVVYYFLRNNPNLCNGCTKSTNNEEGVGVGVGDNHQTSTRKKQRKA